MPAAMMSTRLNMRTLLGHAATIHAGVEIVTKYADGREHRDTYGEMARRVARLRWALDHSLGVPQGARVATLGWNHQQHLELYMGVPTSGRVLHPINLRLSPDEIAFILDDAEDAIVFADTDQLPLLEKVQLIRNKPLSIVRFGAEYEDVLMRVSGSMPAVNSDEDEPMALCYTSGTTGRPKAVQYTHRSVYLHSLTTTSRCSVDIGPSDCVLPGPPMFHTMGWGLPHAAVLAGAKLVFWAGPLDPDRMVDLFHRERVTVSAGVPTVWTTLQDSFKRLGTPESLRHVVCGGARPSRALIRDYAQMGIPMLQLWGMTEVSLGSMSWSRHGEAHVLDTYDSAGWPLPGFDISILNEQGEEVPADGTSLGDLWVAGPWVAASYWRGRSAELFSRDGNWFRTGDVAVRNPDGTFAIADRTKDLIKSGGEWISSVDMENAIVGMAGVREAAVVAMPDAKWQERPLAFIVPRGNGHETPTLDDVRTYLTQLGWAKWQLPDHLEVLDELPRTSVGKIDKKHLRAHATRVDMPDIGLPEIGLPELGLPGKHLYP